MNIELSNKHLRMEISEQGGSILNATFHGIPILRKSSISDTVFDIGKTANFPLIPFGNRVENNRFSYGGKDYYLQKNTAWDTHYLHGDTWQLLWHLTSCLDHQSTLEVEHEEKEGEPYSYIARQTFSLTEDTLSLETYVENRGNTIMPFGMGHHFFFPLTEQTTLFAKHKKYWTEKEGFLPDTLCYPPKHLSFNSANTIPVQWINNGYEDWDGNACILFPEHNIGIEITADTIFGRFFLFRSDVHFEADFKNDYFCFEPMSHTANAHNLENDWGLIPLEHGQSITGNVSIRAFWL